MTPEIKGWCPGALRPMESGDGWVVRVRPRGGRLSGDQAARIAELAALHGNGLIDLSSRANLQIRGVRPETYPSVLAGLDAAGLLDRTEAEETARNIIVQPFWNTGDGTRDLALSLAQALKDAPPLPAKFGYAIDTGPRPVLRDVSADIRIERDDKGLLLRADGTDRGARVTERTAVGAVLELAHWFVSAGGVVDGRGRMATLIASGARLPDRFHAVEMSPVVPVRRRPGPCPAGALVGFEFGQVPADLLGRIAALGGLRITPWRMVVIEGAEEMPVLPGLITRAEDPMLRVIACPGAPACRQAHQPTRALTRSLAGSVPEGALLHISGCAKGCAHRGVADVTLVGTPDGFDLVRAGGTAARGLVSEALSAGPDHKREVFG